MGRLFGTDGARGVANTELTCELAMQIGRAAALVLTEDNGGKRPVVMIGKDTRASGAMLEGALIAGLCSVGADVILLGIVPTPAVAFMVTTHHADAGIMISASHNPCEYNGIKIFASTGYKLPDAEEAKIEAIVLDNAQEIPAPIGGEVGRVTVKADAVDEYVEHVASTIDARLDGLKIALDCANGSASATAQKLFSRLGADFDIFCHEPDGVNIGLRNVSLSTCGLVPQMRRFAEEGLPVTLSLSLHAPNDAIRRRLMPVANAYKMDDVLDACRYYIEKTGRRVIFEYALNEINSRPEHAAELAGRLRGMQCHVNVIPLNAVEEKALRGADEPAIARFMQELEKRRISVTRRREMGDDIDGACGQLRRRYLEKNE